MAIASEVVRAAGQESLLSVPVSLPYVDEPILLSVGDRVTIPTEFWNYAADSVNMVVMDDYRLNERGQTWLSDVSDPTITGVVRWLGTLPPISDTQLFAGIQTVSLVSYVKKYIYNYENSCLHRTLLSLLTTMALVVLMLIKHILLVLKNMESFFRWSM